MAADSLCGDSADPDDPLPDAGEAARLSPRWQRRLRRFALLSLDSAGCALIYAAVYGLRYDRAGYGAAWIAAYLRTLPLLLLLRGLIGHGFRIYDWSFRLASISEAVAVAKSAALASLLFFSITWYIPWLEMPPPRLVLAAEFGLSLLWMGALRFGPKHLTHRPASGALCRNAFVYGAGSNAELFLRDLRRAEHASYRVVGFLDDNPRIWKTRIHGVPILGGIDRLAELTGRYKADIVLIAIPRFSGARLRGLIERSAGLGLNFKILPHFRSILEGAAPPAWQDVSPIDLLERAPVNFDPARIRALAEGKTALVTGAAGSIGSEICRQLAAAGVGRLVLFDLDENQSYLLGEELAGLDAARPGGGALDLRVELGSVRDAARMDEVFGLYRPALVFHAAAYKHVPLMEANPVEALKNNVLGTWLAARAARTAGAERFILISTDKAVNPANAMGAAKRVAERLVCQLDRPGPTRFQAVRFGNVLGSAGSLLPILRRQVARGGPVTITHKDMTRYFMTIPEAVGLVLATAALDEGILCVLDMGEPVSIDRLARNLVVLAGRTPDRDIEIRYIGPRPGEKMHEELFLGSERRRPSSHPKIQIVENDDDLDVEAMLADLDRAIALGVPEAARAFLSRHVPGYQP